ncbi:MAG: metalloregulator ArsR/SmtB family transcription factor [Chloroflexi bacterium]|nr:metalloregulator ArsR/SmtB family transcription factor [Chloroflexota bacterium]
MAQLNALDACLDETLHPDQAAKVLATALRDDQYEELATYFRALGEPSRVRLLHCLLSAELCVCDLAALTNLSVAATSQHLRTLRNLHLVTRRREGKVMWYSLADDHIRSLLSVTREHLTHAPSDSTPDSLASRGERHDS